jgi:hypothetical protein
VLRPFPFGHSDADIADDLGACEVVLAVGCLWQGRYIGRLARLVRYDPQGMNHPREEYQQAKQDVDKKVLADTPFHSDGDGWQENGE